MNKGFGCLLPAALPMKATSGPVSLEEASATFIHQGGNVLPSTRRPGLSFRSNWRCQASRAQGVYGGTVATGGRACALAGAYSSASGRP